MAPNGPEPAPNLHFGGLGVAIRWFRVKNCLRSNYFAPAGSLRLKSIIFPDIRKVQAMMFLIFQKNECFS